MPSQSKVTTDHDAIQEWVESRGGHPATVEGTGDGDPGILRIDFPGYGEDEGLREISWEDFFEKFEQEQLAFLHQDQTSSGDESRFHKFISRN